MQPSLLDPNTNLMTGETIVPKPTVDVPFKLPETVVTDAVTDTSGGGSLLGMPTIGEATTQVGVNVASQMAMDAIAGDPPEASYGQVVDLGYAPVYEASQQANFFQSAMEPYSGNRDPMGMYGSTANNTYAQYMRMVGTA